MPRPIAIDLFAGAGGMSLGFEQAGFKVAAAVEIDPIHSAVHLFNFPECAMIASSVSALTGREIRRLAKIGQEPVNVVFGGPPCQGFSLIGHRAIEDPRNLLVRDYLRLVSELDASYFVFENVKGITVGKHRLFLEEFIEDADELGYKVTLPWKVLNAAHFGVPQYRERLILFGAKKQLRSAQYPNAITGIAGRANPERLPVGPTCEDALSDLPNAEDFDALLESDSVRVRGWRPRVAFSKEMHCESDTSWHFGIPRKWDADVLTSSARTEHTAISKRRFAETPNGEVEPTSRFFKLPPRGVSNTLRAGTDSARGAFTSPRPIHYKWPRCVTVREMARLHGFPDWFRFNETKWHGARQIGNAVPPPMARAIAASVMAALETKPSRSNGILELGNPRLLAMNMASASRYFEIDVPIKGRDRKSGTKKRKQTPRDEAEAALHSKAGYLNFAGAISV